MGATVSQCVPACCSCCLSSHAGDHNGATTKARTSTCTASTRTRNSGDDDDETDSWLQKGKVPLLSARHDQEITVDDCTVVVRKVGVMRSPTQTKAQTQTQLHGAKHGASQHASPRSPGAPPRRGLRAVSASTDQRRAAAESLGERRSPPPQSDHYVDDSPNSSNEDGSWELTSPGRGSGDASASTPHTRSERSLSAASHESRSSVVHDNNDNVTWDGNNDEETKTGPNPRLPRSPGAASSSPKRKTRYGRKNYRADSSRKKTV